MFSKDGHDGFGSVRALTDATGAVTDTYTYDAFGNLLDKSGSTPNDSLFTGECIGYVQGAIDVSAVLAENVSWYKVCLPGRWLIR